MKPEDAPFHVKQVLEDGSALGITLDLSQAHALERFGSLLQDRGPPLGLVSRADLPRLYTRHVLDCLRAAPAFGRDDRLALDLGSGAGLPGIVLAVSVPECRFVLVEPRSRRVGFLELAVERLGLRNVDVAPTRVEDLPQTSADVCTARAFGPLGRSWGSAEPLLRPGGRLVYFAGAGLGDPERAAEGLDPPPASVTSLDVLASEPPLVIITRR